MGLSKPNHKCISLLLLTLFALALMQVVPAQAGSKTSNSAGAAGYTPSDPLFTGQWSLHNTGQEVSGSVGTPGADIDAVKAWGIERGYSKPVTVAFIDSGIDMQHPDLKKQIWSNTDEIPGNDVDDDRNGYVDDAHGYNWAGISQKCAGYWIGKKAILTFHPFGDVAAHQTYAQSIKGTGCRLTHVGVVISKVGSPVGNITIRIKDASWNDLAHFNIAPSEIIWGELYKRLSVPLELENGITYYIVWSTTNESQTDYYNLSVNRGNDPGNYDQYLDGAAYTYDGSTLTELVREDFYFRTNPNENPRDDGGHGTSTASVVCAACNGTGMVGVSHGAKAMPLKVSCCGSYGEVADVVAAIYYAVNNGARVINMSLTYNCPMVGVQDAINYAHKKGVVIVAAAGGTPDSNYYLPAACRNVIGVGGTSKTDGWARFTHNSSVDVTAPGQDIYFASPGYPCFSNGGVVTDYRCVSASCLTCPFVSGLAALILSKKPSYRPDQVERAIEYNAEDLGAPGRDDYFGYGRINAYRTLSNLDLPHIDSISPNRCGPGDEVTIEGRRFAWSKGSSTVMFNGVKATDFTSWGPTRIKCRVPSGARSGRVTVGTYAGRSNEVSCNITTPTWYLAEGSTDWGFDTLITIQNPNGSAVDTRVTYMPVGASSKTETITLPPTSQTTLTGDHLISVMGDKADFSTRVECADHSRSIAVDRTMTWRGQGASSPEAHSSVGVTSPEKTWYLPEGSAAWGFECWVLVQNPNPTAAEVKLNYMVEGEGLKSVSHRVEPNSRSTFDMSQDIGSRDASIRVASDLPVIAERSMYRNNRREGHCSVGARAPAKDFYLAEGTTDYGFTTYVLVQNPNDAENAVTLTYMTPQGPVPTAPFTMPAHSRKTIRVNDVAGVSKTDLSTRVQGTLPIVAERAMYWDSGTGEACHDSIGMADPHTTFYLPDGEGGKDPGGVETWTLVANPNDTGVNVEVTYMTPTGEGNVTFTAWVPAYSRSTFNESEKIEGRASIMVTSKTPGKKLIVERAMYRNARGWGTDTVGGYGDEP
jgi:Subtilase family/IPT/TIG domain/Family of unknown function (DUF5719)